MMNTKEARKEWEMEISLYNGKPVILKKEDVRTIITDAINGASTYWCDYCGIEKPVEIDPAAPEKVKGEPEAEAIANGGELAFYTTEAFETDEEGNDIEKYPLTLDKLIKGVKTYIETCPDERKENLLILARLKDEYGLDLTYIDGYIVDEILQTTLFGEPVFC